MLLINKFDRYFAAINKFEVLLGVFGQIHLFSTANTQRID
jgi:hypothetical protein